MGTFLPLATGAAILVLAALQQSCAAKLPLPEPPTIIRTTA
jgi:hypothetical protein